MSKTQSLNDIFAQLSAQGIAVNSMRNKVNRLEELFIRLVDGSASAGRAAAVADPEAGVKAAATLGS
jgi:ABC-2 type transport system ATP-binding protein